MTLSRDPDKLRAWKRRGARKYEERVRREVLDGERPWNSIPSVNRERRERERERVYGPPERREWVRSLPSVVSGKRPCEQAHVPPDGDLSGMGRRADACWIVPLTTHEHAELHAVGRETFERVNRVDLAAEAERIEEMWQERRENS